jgi:hypothetical protein
MIERQAIQRGTYGLVKDLNAESAPTSTAGMTAATCSLGQRPWRDPQETKTQRNFKRAALWHWDQAGTSASKER